MRGRGPNERYGFFGYPVSHSLSPGIFNAAFRAAGTDAAYDLYAITPDRIGEGIREFLGRKVGGLNVTRPRKSRVIPMTPVLDESARLTGAVNATGAASDGMAGNNTDTGGFGDGFTCPGVPGLRGCRGLVLGAADGKEMLLRQAARVFKVWYQHEAPLDAMREAASGGLL